MSDLRLFSKTFMLDFIELYKSFPCLWKTKSSDYKNRYKKDKAYSVLLKKLQEIEPDATKQTVKAKINSIRGSFRRETKKIKNSKRSGSGTDDIYVTHLWYYDLLLFTRDQEMPRESVGNVVKNEEGESGTDQEVDDEGENNKQIEHVDDHQLSQSTTTDRNQHASSSSTSSATTNKSSKRKRKPNKVDKQADEVLTMVSERLRNSTTDDEALNLFGQHVAAKLRTLPKETKLYTEKLINDLIFEAEMGNVDKNTKIVTSLNRPTSQSL